jgi:hypothetical protein
MLLMLMSRSIAAMRRPTNKRFQRSRYDLARWKNAVVNQKSGELPSDSGGIAQ